MIKAPTVVNDDDPTAVNVEDPTVMNYILLK